MPHEKRAEFAMKCSDCSKRITVGMPIALITANRKWVHKRCWYRRANPPWAAKTSV